MACLLAGPASAQDSLLTSVQEPAAFTGKQEPAAHVDFTQPVQVYILAGQSNMEGKAQIPLLEHLAQQEKTQARFAHLRDGDGWKHRDDVWIKFGGPVGKLTVGWGSPGRIGPELDFGFTVGDHHEAPVLLIKTAWGGKSLHYDFRPPSAGPLDPKIIDSLLDRRRKEHPRATREQVLQSSGHFYRLMLEQIRDTLEYLDQHLPGYSGQGYEIAGLIWFQGWNDMVNEHYTAHYADNMACFIRDVRHDLKRPKLPIVIGQLGVGGPLKPGQEPKKQAFKDAQATAARLPEFAGTVALVRTDAFWDHTAQAVFDKGWRDHVEEWEKVGSDYPYHYLGSPITYCDIGRAFAHAVLALGKEQG